MCRSQLLRNIKLDLSRSSLQEIPRPQFGSSRIKTRLLTQQRPPVSRPTVPCNMPSPRPRPLYSRPLDTLYIIWLFLHLLTTLLIDIVPFYPVALQFEPLLRIRADYIADFKDPLVANPPPWFVSFLWAEALYQVPACGWGVWGLWSGELSTYCLGRRALDFGMLMLGWFD